jgi:hypothetical protein
MSLKRAGELKSHEPQSPMRVKGIHAMGCFSVLRRVRLWRCYHHLSATQPSARCLSPWFRWTQSSVCRLRTLPPPRRGRQRLDSEGNVNVGVIGTRHWSQWPRGRRHSTYLIPCTLRSCVLIPLKAWMFVLVCLCYVILCRYRPLLRTYHSSQGVLPCI